MLLTIGMPTFNEGANVWFTLMALREYHDLADVELVVVNNGPHDNNLDIACQRIGARYCHYPEPQGTAAAKNKVFEIATGTFVMCIDSHVLLKAGAISKLKKWLTANPDFLGMFQAPLLYESGGASDMFTDVWSQGMYGQWGSSGNDVNGDEPYEIPSNGMGLFGSRKDAWLGFHPDLRMWGGEEFMGHKYRLHGQKVLCLPFLGWYHLFAFRQPIPYQDHHFNNCRNQILSMNEVGMDISPVIEHYGEETVGKVMAECESCRQAKGWTPKKEAPTLEAIRPVSFTTASKGRVSAICPTYNRVVQNRELLEEAVESFIRQDYPDKEMILLNDHPAQKIVFEHPQVRVINHPSRFNSLGEKLNYAVSLATGEFIAPWDDDDISLPWRLSKSVQMIGDADYFNPKSYWFLCDGSIQYEKNTGYAHNASIYRKSAWQRAGGYPNQSGGCDASLDSNLRAIGSVIDGPLSQEDGVYIYRWGVGPHLSGNSDTETAYRNYANQAKSGGYFALLPHWDIDYTEKASA